MGNKLYFPNLDGLRSTACFMVFSFHALGMGHNRLGIGNVYTEKLLLTFLNGKTGVSIFFVLSGFLITYIILSEIRETGKFSLVHFYIRRILRIWPLYFLILLIVFVLMPAVDHFFSISQTITDTRPWYYFTFLSNFDVLRIFEKGGVDFLPSTITWSVAIEEQFYIFWPLLFFFVPGADYKYIFIFVIAAAFCFRVFHYNNVYQLNFHSLSAIFDLAVGGAAAYLCFSSSKIREKLAGMKDGVRIGVITLGVIVMYVNLLLQSPWPKLIFTTAQVFFFAWVIMDQCFNDSGRLKFSRGRLLSRLGKYTYGIYMIHPLVLLAINLVMVKILRVSIDNLLSIAACFLVGLPLTILLAALSYKYIEKRFLVLKESFSFLNIIPVKS